MELFFSRGNTRYFEQIRPNDTQPASFLNNSIPLLFLNPCLIQDQFAWAEIIRES